MSTNFYRKRVVNENTLKNLHSMLDSMINDNFSEESKNKFDKMLIEFDEGIHICQRAGGWQIAFDHNDGKYYQPSRKSIEEFLTEPNTYIVDEYGNKLSNTDFWTMVDEWNNNPKNKWTSKSYREYEESRGNYDNYYYRDIIEHAEQLFNVQCNDELDFFVDDLRFLVFTDFC